MEMHKGAPGTFFFRFHFLESGQNNMLGLEPPTVWDPPLLITV